MKRIQNFYLHSYRMVGFIFLVGLISSILWYGFTMIFFIGSSSWAVPVILSPSQEKVMSHLEHVLVLEDNMRKDIAELKNLKQNLIHKAHLLKISIELQLRFEKTMVSQSEHYKKESRIYKKLRDEKKKETSQLTTLSSEARNRDTTIKQELSAGLITKEDALVARLASNKIRSDLIEAKVKLHDLHIRSSDFANAAKTLDGSSDDIEAMNRVIKQTELKSQITQLEGDIFSLKITANQLQRNITKKTNALTLMKKSPYIRAIKESTTVAFVPYHNLKNLKKGSPVYSCYLDMIFCYRSGQISNVYNAEEYFPHPIFKSELKGQLIGIAFNNTSDSQKKLLFINSKPLVI